MRLLSSKNHKDSQGSTWLSLIYLSLAIAMLLPQIGPPAALLTGILVCTLFGNPFLSKIRTLTSHLLQLSIIGLGAGMNLRVIGRVGIHSVGYTVAGILFTFAVGKWVQNWIKTESKIALLLNSGTAICGGSAIAAIAAVVEASPSETAMALATIFLLNSAALFLFPPLGHLLELSQSQFGLWSALAIHDTSSVVGASLQYGAEALRIGTTVKLTRALWILPLALVLGIRRQVTHCAKVKVKKPWFILGFALAAALVTFIPALEPFGKAISLAARRLLVLTLFFIGSEISRSTFRELGIRPVVHGLMVWFSVAMATLICIRNHWIT